MSGEPVVRPETNPAQDFQPPIEAATDPVIAEGLDSSATGVPAAPEASPSADPTSASQQVQELEQELASLRVQHESLNGQHMRLAADFDNFRKRQSRDSEDQRLQIICATLGEILPVLDNFDRARQQLNPQHEEAQSLHRSYQGLYRQLVDVFKQLGVSPMRVEGEPFDPMLHEAVLREPSDQHPEDVVIEELQRGYHLNGRVLRHALVKVSMGPGPGDAAAPAEAAQAGPEHEPSAPPHGG